MIIAAVVTGTKRAIMIEKSEILPGVFVRGVLTTVKKGTALVPVLNTSEYKVHLYKINKLNYDNS